MPLMDPDSGMEPFVSIIVPVKNEEHRLPTLLAVLCGLDYPRDRYEIIVADNGSTDRTVEVVRSLLGVTVCVQPTGGSYAARNAGIRVARGEVLAFTDSDCTPEVGWLRTGVARLNAGADLVAGAIRFDLSRASIDHRFDRKFFLQQERWVAEKKAGATANLFVRRSVIDRVGGFSEELTSGGDFAFCKKATEAGCDLVFEPSAIVSHPTRGLAALLKKARRIGGGKIERLRHTTTTSKEVMPQKRQLAKLLEGESLATKCGFLAIYGAVCAAGVFGALTYLWRSRSASTR
jgi:cellulose synthase/poly-beta-1,6-N-acetylglucosamine synthase-like glycosyltransferase